MEFAFTQEQEELRREARGFLEANADAPLRSCASSAGSASRCRRSEAAAGSRSSTRRSFSRSGAAPHAGPFLTTAVVLPRSPRSTSRPGRSSSTGRPPPRRRRPRPAGRHDHRARRGRDAPHGRRDEAARPARRRRGRGARRRLRAGRLRLLAGPRGRGRRRRRRALELGVEYVSAREQFGKKIGTYQAVSHPLADTYVETELARSLAYWAAWCVAEKDEQAPAAVASAKAFCADRRRGLRALDPGARRDRLHLEHVLHRYYKRAQWIDAFGGNAAKQREVVAATLLD